MRVADIGIIGGGASAMAASIEAAKKGCSVIVLERLNRVGKKLLSTGNGRCNITNENLDIANFYGNSPLFADFALNKFGLRSTISFFSDIGIEFVTLSDGKMYPKSLQASSVLDLLRIEMSRLGVIEVTDFFVTSIIPQNDHFIIESDLGDKVKCKKVIVAAGGCAAPAFGTDGSAYSLLVKTGHRLVDTYPSLVQLKCKNPLRSLKGVKQDGQASVYVDNKLWGVSGGEILFTEYGISGPPIFNISRVSKQIAEGKAFSVSINFFPELTLDDVRFMINKRAQKLPHLYNENFLNGIINKRIGLEIMKRAKNTEQVAKFLCDFRLEISGTMNWANAQVTAGGINTDDFNDETMESKLVPGLYAAGEILDIVGDCGGFNLQWAWSSGRLAAISAAKSLGGNNA